MQPIRHRRTVIGAVAGIVLTGGSTTTDERTPTAESDRSDDIRFRHDGRGDPAASASATDPDSDVTFELGPYELSECGVTCRDVTATITNTGDSDAIGVRVTVTLTAADERLYRTTEYVGVLEAGESVTRTDRVDLGFGAALAVSANGDRVTVTTVIESERHGVEVVRDREIET